MNQSPRFRQQILGLGATLLLVLLVGGFPLALIAMGAAPWDADIGQLQTLLTSPDDGTLALVVFAVVGWGAWAVMAVSVVVEAAAQLRGISSPPLPGLALPQRAAGQLVAAAALLFIAAPVALSGFPAGPTTAAAAPPVPRTPRLEVVATAAPVPVAAVAPAPSAVVPDQEKATVDYTVKRGDSLWKISEHLLGDGARYPAIVELNRGVLGGRPDFITSGTVLKVPHVPDESAEDGRTPDEYVVRTGDTLWAIAEAEVDDPTRYPEIFAASRSTVQPDGARLVDPDLIQPGWKLTIPAKSLVAHNPVKPPKEAEPPRNVGPAIEPSPVEVPPVEPPSPTAATGPMVEPEPSTDTASDATSDTAEATVDDQAPGWMLPGLSGAGALLAAGVYFAVRAHRRTQLRYRLPGQTIAPPPSELLSVEKTVFISGTPLVDALGTLDRVLRQLAASLEAEGQALPSVTSAILARGTLALRLHEPADLPPPWEGEDREWSTTLEGSTHDVDQVAPYPLLVSIGQDTAGRLHLLNLEQLRVLSLVGDRMAALALARHIAAELALNPWSVLVEVDTVGIGEELTELDRMRLRQHRAGATVIDQIVVDLRKARALSLSDPDPFRVVVTTMADDVAQLIEILGPATTRLGSAVIALDGAATAPGSVIGELTKEGRLRVPDLGLDLVAAGLTSDEASACAAIVDLTSKSPAIDIPCCTEATDGWRSLADHAGALRDELTDVRSDGPAGDRSLLPNETVDYVNVAATVTEDVETLAPIVSDEVRRRVEDADETLDDDVAEWFREDCRLPRLTLLGPVTASAHGAALPVVAKRKPYFVEMLTYLALHPEGRTGNAVADAFSISASRARTDLGHLRAWLGTNPRTCRPHLPLATDSRAYARTGVRAFQLEDVLVDIDLFRRLRARGEARGARGIEDLAAALRLVVGLPFDLLRERGWHWLLDDNRLNETIAASIVDTAHVVVLNALANGDVSTARSAAETACQAAPHDDICRLDLIKTAVADGDDDIADEMFRRDVCNRSDDYLPPIDLPNRTGKVVEGQSWGSNRLTEIRPRGPRP